MIIFDIIRIKSCFWYSNYSKNLKGIYGSILRYTCYKFSKIYIVYSYSENTNVRFLSIYTNNLYIFFLFYRSTKLKTQIIFLLGKLISKVLTPQL